MKIDLECECEITAILNAVAAMLNVSGDIALVNDHHVVAYAFENKESQQGYFDNAVRFAAGRKAFGRMRISLFCEDGILEWVQHE